MDGSDSFTSPRPDRATVDSEITVQPSSWPTCKTMCRGLRPHGNPLHHIVLKKNHGTHLRSHVDFFLILNWLLRCSRLTWHELEAAGAEGLAEEGLNVVPR